MKKYPVPFTLILCVVLVSAVTAFAQNNRSFVSTTGNDANACTAGNECRSFSRALSVTNPGGEVVAISSGGYGSFSITQAVSVNAASGVLASITATSGNAIMLLGHTADHIALRNLDIVMSGGNQGIAALAFGSLVIESCRVFGAVTGINIANASASSSAVISDTAVHWSSSGDGFDISSPATLIRCLSDNNAGYGLLVLSGSTADGNVEAVDLVSIANLGGAAVLGTISGHLVSMTLDRSLLARNSLDGVYSESQSGAIVVARVTNSSAVDNGRYGFFQNSTSTFGSLNNNLVDGNTAGPTNGSINILSTH